VKATQRNRALLRQLRALYNIGTFRDLTDGQLLERFATDAGEGAELAFSALVERHEAMVWRVCLAILRDEHAAADAFQATFLVLLRKARSLWVRDSLGPWLHQVACRTASSLRRADIRRRKHEQHGARQDSGRSAMLEALCEHELDAAIQEEVNRLPEKFRAPLVLCDLEGRTHQEAARCLGWPIGTVKSRQSHGRGLIRDRLLRRGMALGAAGAVAESLRQTAVAATSKGLLRKTVAAAMQQSARSSIDIGISAHILTLTQEVLRAMFWIKVRFFAIAAIALLVASSGASVFVSASQEPDRKNGQPASKPPATKSAQASSSKLATEQPPSPDPKRALRAQQLTLRKAQARFEIARATRELAEIALEEYEQSTYPQDLATAEGEIKLAESDLSRSEDRLEWAKKMFDKKYVTPAQKVSEELSNKKAKFTLEQAQSKKKVLVEYTKGKSIKELRSEIDKARVGELEKKAILELESAKEKELEQQLRPKKN
jgi:HlyD family secretion protein